MPLGGRLAPEQETHLLDRLGAPPRRPEPLGAPRVRTLRALRTRRVSRPAAAGIRGERRAGRAQPEWVVVATCA
eukprot:1290999-Alexandrium_andersonii.AAC.1